MWKTNQRAIKEKKRKQNIKRKFINLLCLFFVNNFMNNKFNILVSYPDFVEYKICYFLEKPPNLE